MSDAFPDPILTANLYCAGRLNEAVFGAVRPAWRAFQEAAPERLWYLWFMRYGKGGEHLKIRLHGPAPGKDLLAGLLTDAAGAFFAAVEPPAAAPPPGRWANAPPLDAQDRVSADHPDRTLLWTDYARSPVSLGGEPFLGDDVYAARMTACLARAAEIVLEALTPDHDGAFPHGRRQSTLLGGLVAALAALGFTAEQRSSYLRYHRDSLLRFLLIKSEEPVAAADAVLAQFNGRVAAMATSFQTVQARTAERWRHGPSARSAGELETAWCQSLVRLHAHIAPLVSDPGHHLDPFAPDPAFSPLFKALHGLANALGIGLWDEALAHHLLLLVADPESSRRVVLLPE